MNNVSIIGRITKDIELRATTSGLPAVSMFIAINNGKDKDGNERPADFPKIYVYDKQAENVNEYCHKGSLVGITGRIKTRTWDKEDGTKGYETYILFPTDSCSQSKLFFLPQGGIRRILQ